MLKSYTDKANCCIIFKETSKKNYVQSALSLTRIDSVILN